MRILLAAALLLIPLAMASCTQEAVVLTVHEQGKRTNATGTAVLDQAAGDILQVQVNATWARTCRNRGTGDQQIVMGTSQTLLPRVRPHYDAATKTWNWNQTITPKPPRTDPCPASLGAAYHASTAWDLSAQQTVCARIAYKQTRNAPVIPPTGWTCLEA